MYPNVESGFEQRLARTIPQSMQLQLHVLPAHQELVAPLPTGYVGPVMMAAEEWLTYHGYRTLGPWMISWAPNGQPQLRRPVSGALKAVKDKDFQTVEVPDQLLVAVPFSGWPILPHNFIGPVSSVGLDVSGSPLLLALTNDPPTIAWVPVMPRGTVGLKPKNYTKLGLQPKPPSPGKPLPIGQAWFNASLLLGRAATILSILFCGLIGLGVIVMLLGERVLTLPAIMALVLVPIRIFIEIPEWIIGIAVVIWFIGGLIETSRISAWNTFWGQRPPPPELLLGSRGEGQVGSWLK